MHWYVRMVSNVGNYERSYEWESECVLPQREDRERMNVKERKEKAQINQQMDKLLQGTKNAEAAVFREGVKQWRKEERKKKKRVKAK